MKKQFFAAATAVALLCSCSKEHENPAPQTETEGTEVSVTFDRGKLQTRAFFDDTVTPEAWENAVNNLIIYTFDSGGNWAATYEATKEEIAAGKLSFVIPSRLSTKQVTFYAIANSYLFSNPTRSYMDDALDSYTSLYNGKQDGNYTSARKYAEGFTMSAVHTTVMPLYGVPENIHFDLKRTVAKIAIRVKLSPKFIQRYPGHSFILKLCGVSNVASQGHIMESEPEKAVYMSGGSYYSTDTTLSLDSTVDFLLYAGASGKLAEDLTATQRPYILLNGTLVAPNGGRRDVLIAAPFNTENGSEVRRNAYYRFELGVTGIYGTDFTSTLESQDWSTSTINNKNIGY